MSVTFSPPVITGTTPAEQMQQVQSWLFKFSEQLNYTLNNLDSGNFSDEGIDTLITSSGKAVTKEEVKSEYDSIKSIIVKTADIVDVRYDELTKVLESNYFAKSDFGEYFENAVNDIKINADGIQQNFLRLSEITEVNAAAIDKANSDIEGVNDKINNVTASFTEFKERINAYIITGWLEQQQEYGVAIGETVETEIDGVKAKRFDQLATLTSRELAFWQDGVKLGYFKGNSLFVNGNVRIGSWMLDPSYGFAIKHIEGE